MALVMDARRPAARWPRVPVGARIPVAAAVFVLAVAARAVPLLRGGGLRGYGSYDDSVYFAAASGWVHGRWPYRDFILMHPPGIVVLLAPFAALGSELGDSYGVAAARFAWIVMGGLTSAGIVALLWRTGRLTATIAGFFYAVFWPATMVERVTDLEGPQNFLLIIALLLLRPFEPSRAPARGQRAAALVAGAALSLAWSVKIWELAPIIVLAVWLAWRRRRVLLWFVGGVGLAIVAVCAPFFIHAPQQMWADVVADQLGRPRQGGWMTRLVDITGTGPLVAGHHTRTELFLVVVAVTLAVALAWRRPAARIAVVLYAVGVLVLVQSPPTFTHYGAFVAVPMALVIGFAATELTAMIRGLRWPAVRRGLAAVATAGVVTLLAVLASAPATARVERPAPSGRLAAMVAIMPGCIPYDESSEALALNLVSRDLDRGCPFIVDLGAASRWTRLPAAPPGKLSSAESLALHYLRGGSACLLYRFPPGHRSKHGVNVTGRWKVLAKDHKLLLVKALPANRSPS